VADDLPTIRDASRSPALRDAAPVVLRSEPETPVARRFGRRLLGIALLAATLGVGSCHAFFRAAFG
jgi:hypothetical protein